MELLNYVNDKQLKKQLPQIKPGHIVAVHQKIREGDKERIQVFKGIVIRVKGGYGLNGSFTVRRVASGVGVEKTFLFNSPLVEKIEVMKRAKTRRSKLYYLRGLYGKSAKLNLLGEKDGAEDLIRDIVGDEPEKEEKAEEGDKAEKKEAEAKKDKQDENKKKDAKKEDAKKEEVKSKEEAGDKKEDAKEKVEPKAKDEKQAGKKDKADEKNKKEENKK